MCNTHFGPMMADDLLRLVLTFFLCACCVILYFIITQKKVWDIAFWFSFVGFLSVLAIYGNIVEHIFLANTFSYDGFISGAAIITIFGLLFSKPRYIAFADSVFSKNGPILFATFIVFGLIYLSTVNYSFTCVSSAHQLFIDVLHIFIYPLLLLFAVLGFLYRFIMCISVFAICMALFIIQNVVFIFRALTLQHNHDVLIEEIICSCVSIVLSMFAILILTKAKKVYKDRKNGNNRGR